MEKLLKKWYKKQAAMNSNNTVAIFTLEMAAEQLATRMIASVGKIELGKLKRGNMAHDDLKRFNEAISRLADTKIYIDDTCVYTVNPAKFDIRYNNSKRIANGTTYNLGTYSKTITHDEDGSKSLKIKCQHYTSVSPGYATCEGTFTCAKINVHRQTYLTVPNNSYDIGSSITIQANPKSTEYTHALNVSLDNSNWANIQNGLRFGTANANNNYKFTIPTEFKNSISEQKTGTMYVKLSTWLSGSYIGVETKTVSIKNNDQNLRASYLSVPNEIYNIGSNITVQGNPCKAGLIHKLLVSTDNASWITVKEDFKLNNVNANNPITFTIPNDLKTLIPAKSEGTIYVSLSTYNNGLNLGYERKTVKIYNDSDKSTGTFEFSNKMINTNGKYYYSDNKKIVDIANIIDITVSNINTFKCFFCSNRNGFCIFK